MKILILYQISLLNTIISSWDLYQVDINKVKRIDWDSS